MVFLCAFVWALGLRRPPVPRVVLLGNGQWCSRTWAWPKVAREGDGAIPSICPHGKATSQDLRAPVCPQTITADLSRDDIFICHRPKVLNTFPPGAEGEREKNNWKSGTASLAVDVAWDPPLSSYCLVENWKQKKTIWPDLDRRIYGVALVSLMRAVILCSLKFCYSGTLDVLDVFIIRAIVIFN